VSEPAVILGAGLAGLSAAYHAKKRGIRHLLFERAERVGGLVRSENVGGFTFDYTGHLLHMKEERTKKLVLSELGLKHDFVMVERNSWVYMNGRYTRAPFQANLFGQPDGVVRECLAGMLEARALGLKARGRKSARAAKGPESFESWNLRTFGEGIYRHFMEPYNSKLWGIHPSQMTVEFMGRFIPQPSLKQVFQGALHDVGKPMGYNAAFIYPRKGGIEILSRAFGRKVAARLNHTAVQIDLKAREVTFANGLRQRYTKLVSTMPLTRLVALLKSKPARVERAASRLRASSVLNVNYGIRGRNVSDKQWIYVPEPHLPFYRVGFYHNFSQELAPKGGSSVYAEMSYSADRPINKKEAPRRVREGLIKMGILRKSDKIAAEFIADIPAAYVVYDSHRTQSVETIQSFLKENGVVSTGRWGNWEYSAMEDAIWQGADAVK
jgi:protoporphyrinogen oxidase